jgi:hypothetical protein
MPPPAADPVPFAIMSSASHAHPVQIAAVFVQQPRRRELLLEDAVDRLYLSLAYAQREVAHAIAPMRGVYRACPPGLRRLVPFRRVRIRCKTDQEGQGAEVAGLRGCRLRPVEAAQSWLAAAEISAGPVFRAVALGGRVSDEALADDSASRIVKRYARRVGLDVAAYSGHSLRSGFLTSAAESGASVFKMSEVSRHKFARHIARLRAAC